jgi:hypothetical protein
MAPRGKAGTLAAIVVLVVLAGVWAFLETPGGRFGGDDDGTRGGERQGADRSYWEYDLSVATGESSASSPADGCAPFFDDDPATAYQPSAPALDPFDRAVLRACGPIRGRVSAEEFETLVLDHLPRIRPRLPADWRELDDGAIHSKLAAIWLAGNGFDHVFCGEWEKGRVGGLHFRGRYLQLQREASACFRVTDRLERDADRIYAIGVASADGAEFAPIKSYALAQSALDVLALGTAGFSACCGPGADWRPYGDRFGHQVFIPSDEGGTSIMNRLVCGTRDRTSTANAALTTLYPDATPGDAVPQCRF